MKRYLYFFTALSACALALAGCSDTGREQASSAAADTKTAYQQGDAGFNLANLHRHIKTLASDEFGGRGPLSQGETLTTSYLAKAYQQAGLAPGAGDGFLQKVPMAKLTPDQDMVLQLGDLHFAAGKDFTARTKQINPEVRLKDSELVFVGYGINAPEYQWNDYAGLDVKGKTLLMLVNDPGFATQDDNLFTGNAMTYYGRWTYKYEEAARQGAKGVLIVHETDAAGYPWGVVENSNTGSKFTLVDENSNSGMLPVMGWLHLDAAERLFARAGMDYQALKAGAKTRGFKPVPLALEANLTLNSQIEQAESDNVVALLPGTKLADEYIVISAHWDHLGTKQTPGGPKIHNGAVDNATGTAATLELARTLMARSKASPFKRSIVFVNYTAEETGLIGSELFAEGGLYPSKQMVAVLNIDGMNPSDSVDYILQYGKNMSEMEHYLADAAGAQGRRVKMDPRPQNGLFFRSDHFSLAKQGVPGLLFMSLGDTDPDYISHKYHKEADDYSAAWSLAGMEQDMALLQAIALKLANSDHWPKWLADSDFKKRRALDGR
ncbi:M20/M25/M40 family metallo-hydrolase [Thalassomonas viridans]|uniref:M20/M25/M40 family metallo-hydrolase n=1 Tax=Thalassomonas viridans TaxID=137584 RepID=A0AAE9YZG3_9GAMM|nr:M28 family metallopeptidase [Thalassomonas viridans]WDE03768.1 M20/M25/M40 family metallo-hydrolase [Thalassomonas viridans]